MFVEVLDEDRAILLWLMTGTSNTDADYRAYVESIRRADEIARDKPVPVALLVVDPGNPIPGSAWRRRIADASADLKSRPLFALVTSSQLVRGTLTAINWIRPPSYPFAAFATLHEATRWIEERRGPTPGLVEMLAKARALADAKAPAPAD